MYLAVYPRTLLDDVHSTRIDLLIRDLSRQRTRDGRVLVTSLIVIKEIAYLEFHEEFIFILTSRVQSRWYFL